MAFKFNPFTGTLDLINAVVAAVSSFTTIQTPSGTSPVATSSADTLTYTTSDNSLVVTGNSSTDTVDYKVATASTILRWIEDWDGAGSSGTLGWDNNSSGGNVSTSAPVDGNHIGIIKHAVNGNGTQAVVFKGNNYMCGGGTMTFEMLIYINDLSSSAGSNATYLANWGMSNGLGVDDSSTGLWFTYTDTANSGNWICNTGNNGAKTASNTSIPAVAGAWTKLKFVVNAAGTSATFFINGVSAATITTNIPTNHPFWIALGMKQTNGGTNQPQIWTDYCALTWVPTTPR